jgi:hypothetical protein
MNTSRAAERGIDADCRLVLWHSDTQYVRDHLPPHFHAVYGEYEAFVAIETGEVMDGALPRTASRLVKEWTLARRDQLRENWRRARAGEQPERIAGLDAD